MSLRTLATINSNRQITHEAGETIYIHWDEHLFIIPRPSFIRLVRTLEYGSHLPYAGNDCYSVVQVDDNLREVWIGEKFLPMNANEYRALLNAALKTETRLHGFQATAPCTEETPAAKPALTLHRPRPIQFCWN